MLLHDRNPFELPPAPIAHLADKLAARVIAHVEKTGDEDIIAIMSRSLGDSSQTLQEAFITSVRVQRAALRADRLLKKRIAEIVTIVVMTLLQLGIDVTTDVEDKFFFMFFSSKFDVLRLNFAKSGQKSTLEHQNRCLKALFKF